MYLSVMFTFMNIQIGTQHSVKAPDIIFYQNPFSTQAGTCRWTFNQT